jgi:hypothetical protein
MKIAKLFSFAIIIAVFVFLGFLKIELRQLLHQGFWPGLAGCLICIGIVVVLLALQSRAGTNTNGTSTPAKKGAQLEGELQDIIAKFPGPITLKSSGLKWWFLILAGPGMTAASSLVLFVGISGLRAGNADAGIGVGIGVLGIIFSGLGAVIGAIMLRGGWLRLDESGFSFDGVFRRQYSWSEVSGFAAWYYRGNGSVVFNTTRPGRNIWAKINAAFVGGQDAWLSDTYGLDANQLAQLLNVWQSSATSAL